MLKLVEQQQYVFHIQTSLAKRVYLTGDVSQSVKVDVWKTEPVMQVVSIEGMPAAVTKAALEQVEAFILACLAANPPSKRPADVNDVNEVSKEQAEPAAESKPAENKYVASKNSNVFHKPDCAWAKKIKPENLIYYSSRNEAIKDGKRPCSQCKP
jgi:micrococcal nuclease